MKFCYALAVLAIAMAASGCALYSETPVPVENQHPGADGNQNNGADPRADGYQNSGTYPRTDGYQNNVAYSGQNRGPSRQRNDAHSYHGNN